MGAPYEEEVGVVGVVLAGSCEVSVELAAVEVCDAL
jgi:hypothetical protein